MQKKIQIPLLILIFEDTAIMVKKKRIMPILKGCLHWQNEYISIKLSVETDLLIQMKFLSGQGRSETLPWN